jgi:hypothetical protein
MSLLNNYIAKACKKLTNIEQANKIFREQCEGKENHRVMYNSYIELDCLLHPFIDELASSNDKDCVVMYVSYFNPETFEMDIESVEELTQKGYKLKYPSR